MILRLILVLIFSVSRCIAQTVQEPQWQRGEGTVASVYVSFGHGGFGVDYHTHVKFGTAGQFTFCGRYDRVFKVGQKVSFNYLKSGNCDEVMQIHRMRETHGGVQVATGRIYGIQLWQSGAKDSSGRYSGEFITEALIDDSNGGAPICLQFCGDYERAFWRAYDKRVRLRYTFYAEGACERVLSLTIVSEHPSHETENQRIMGKQR